MGILLEFVPNLLVALAFDFLLYITGAGILRVVSLGLLKYQIHSYSDFKELKGKPHNNYIVPYIVGFLFYVLLVFLIAWLN